MPALKTSASLFLHATALYLMGTNRIASARRRIRESITMSTIAVIFSTVRITTILCQPKTRSSISFLSSI